MSKTRKDMQNKILNKSCIMGVVICHPPIFYVKDFPNHQESALEDDYRIGMITQYLNDKQDGETVCIIELWKRALHESLKPNRKDSNELSLVMQSMPGWVKLSSPRKTVPWGNQRCWIKTSGQRCIEEDLPF